MGMDRYKTFIPIPRKQTNIKYLNHDFTIMLIKCLSILLGQQPHRLLSIFVSNSPVRVQAD